MASLLLTGCGDKSASKNASPATAPYATFYKVAVSAMDVGAATFSAAATPAIVDTGTSTLTLPKALFTQVTGSITQTAGFQKYIDASLMAAVGCAVPKVAVTRDVLDKVLPPLTIHLTDTNGSSVALHMPATHSYLLTVGEGSTLQYRSTLSMGNVMIKGVPALSSHIAIFDRANKRMGFAPQQGCP